MGTWVDRQARGLAGRPARLALATTLLALAGAGAATYAERGSPGTGGATVPVAGAGDVITIAPSGVGPLSPQINPADTTPVTLTVENSGASPVSLGTITGSVRTQAGCEGSWFTVAPVVAPGDVAPGAHTYVSSVILNDNDRNQTACTARKLTIDWTAA